MYVSLVPSGISTENAYLKTSFWILAFTASKLFKFYTYYIRNNNISLQNKKEIKKFMLTEANSSIL